LVPAYEAAWTVLQRRLRVNQDQTAVKNRLAHEIVDLVLTGGMTDAAEAAEAAVRRLLP
jgi:hypothetical protein